MILDLQGAKVSLLDSIDDLHKEVIDLDKKIVRIENAKYLCLNCYYPIKRNYCRRCRTWSYPK